MSPKTATISLAILVLTLTLTLSSAHAQANCPASSIPDILKLYELPPAIFPTNVQSFSCNPITKDSIRLSINLQGVCVVTREAFLIKNVLKCAEKISAVISRRNLSDVKGVTVQLYVQITSNFYIPFGGLMTITGAEVTGDENGIKLIQFNSDVGDSPPFPFALLPSEAPKCDSNLAFLPFISPLLVA